MITTQMSEASVHGTAEGIAKFYGLAYVTSQFCGILADVEPSR
jgi:hypothetical protein